LHSKGIINSQAGMQADMAVAGVGGRHRVERIYGKELLLVLFRLLLSTPYVL
jgi:hypothetical protein